MVGKSYLLDVSVKLPLSLRMLLFTLSLVELVYREVISFVSIILLDDDIIDLVCCSFCKFFDSWSAVEDVVELLLLLFVGIV